MKILWMCYVLAISAKVCTSSMNCMDEKCQCVEIKEQRLEIQCPRHLGTYYTGILLFLEEKKSFLIDCCNLDKFQVSMLPNVTVGEVERLKINYCPLSSIKEIYHHFNISGVKVFHYFGSLENGILSKDYYFEGFDNLEEFKLQKINFTGADDDVFENMSKLNTLEVERNGNLSLTPTIFKNLTQLESLHLSNNELEELPDRVFENLTNLHTLYLWGNRLTIINDDTFHGLTNLKLLELSNNKISVVSDNAFMSLPQLTSIGLSDNKISILNPRIFTHNKKIKKISIRYNKNLVLFDYTFENLPLLEEIDLSSCNLSELQTHIFENSTNLKKILLNDNNLRDVPSTFRGFVELKFLDLNKNVISAINETVFEDLTSLEELYLRGNEVKTIHAKAFYNNKNLKKIDLSHNKLVEGKVFEELDNLEKLDLSYNYIENVNAVIPQILPKLKDLYLSHNSISEVNLQHVQLLGNVFIDLEYNNLSRVVFSDLQNKTVSLSNNKIDCNCEAFELLEYVKTQSSRNDGNFQILTKNLTCSPSTYQTLELESLELSKLTCAENNGCPNSCGCHWRPFDKTIIVDCSYRNLTELPAFDIDSGNMFNQTEVHLENNFLTLGSSETWEGYNNVTKLFLSRNQITKIDWLPPKLEVLALDNNHLVNVSVDVLNSSNLGYLTLGNNPWKCDCGSVDLAKFLRSHSSMVHDTEDILCTNKNQLLISLNENEVCFKWTIIVYGLSVLFLGIVILISLLIGLFYKYQYEIKVWLYAHNLCMFLFPEEKSTNKLYDAFISFAPEDEEFVVQNLLPVLEGASHSYKICLPIRDLVPGEFKTTQVTKSILESRRTLVVLSQNFVQSVWGEMEIRTAHTQAMTDEKSSVIIVLYGDVDIDSLDKELQMYLKTNTYVKWGDSYFWNKLKYALPHNKSSRKKGNQKIANVMSCIDDKFNLVQPTSPNPGSTPPILTLDPSELKKHPLNLYSV